MFGGYRVEGAAQGGNQVQGEGMIRDADPHFPAAEAQDLLGAEERLEDPHIGAWGKPLDEPEPGIVQVAEFPELGNVRAEQGKMTLVPFPGDTAQFFDALL
jgi:hypothetical protein